MIFGRSRSSNCRVICRPPGYVVLCPGRPVRFAEVDAASLVFFPRFLEYCHDALEALFADLDGGYARLTQVRDVGIPTVSVGAEYRSPLRYGDVVLVEIEVLEIGRSSVTVRHTLRRESDQAVAAVAEHVFVTTRLSTLEAVPIPDDVRSILERHVVPSRTPPVRPPP